MTAMTMLASDPVPVLLARAALALLFASAAWHKLRDAHGFRLVLAAYRVLPDALVTAAGRTITALEAGVALAWIVAAGGVLAAAGAIGLLATYSSAIAVNLLRGRRTIDCGCGVGGAPQPIGAWLLARNAGLAALALFAIRPVGARALVWADALTLAGALAVLACAWLAVHGLAAAAFRAPRVGAAR
jgi:hypothetical protein